MKKNKKIVALLTLCITLLVSVLAVNVISAIADDVPQWSQVQLSEEYDYNGTVTIPSRTFTLGNKTVDASFVVILPDGSTSFDKQLTLNQSGTYTVRYYVDGDAYYSDEKQFVVYSYLYSFETVKSSAEYIANNGLSVSLAEGDVMTFNGIIDLNDVSIDDALANLIVTPANEGRRDFGRILLTFTDVEDAGRSLTISARGTGEVSDGSYMYSYVTAGGQNQPLTGAEGLAPPYNLHVEGADDFGRPVEHSFSHSVIEAGKKPGDQYGEERPNTPLLIKYDSHSKEVFAVHAKIDFLVADLDNSDYFSTLWNGFSSGKVRLTIKCALYENSYANFVIKSIYGLDLSSGKIDDTQGPNIKIDSKYQDEMPLAVKGKEYLVPTATARDDNSGVCDVQTIVWFNYNTPNASMVSLKDGKFLVDRVGTYAIVYKAVDAFGNVSTKRLFVTSKATLDTPTVIVDENHVSAMLLGQKIKPASYTVESASGDADVVVKVRFESTEYDLINGEFMPEKVGQYSVVYYATDYVGQMSVESYAVDVQVNPTPVFVDLPDFPLVLIGGSQHKLPDVYVNDYSSGQLQRILVAPQLVDANGKNAVQNNLVTANVTNSGEKATLIYEYKDAVLTIEIPVISVWSTTDYGRPKINLQEYLFSQDNSILATKEEQFIAVDALTSDASFVFANALPAERCEVIFNTLANKCKYDAIKLTFVDAQRHDVAFDVTIVNNGKNNASVQIGTEIATVPAYIGLGARLDVRYASNKVSVGTSTFDVTTCNNGNPFEGFVSDKVYLKVAFVNVTAVGNATINLESVNGHAMTNLSTDRTAPKVVVCGEYGGVYKLNSLVVIPKCLIGDALDPNVTATINVTDPNGNVVTSVDGVALKDASPFVQNSFYANEYGRYQVVIKAYDTFNSRANETRLDFVVTVADDVKPTITFTQEIKETAKVGEVIVLPDFTVQDNITQSQDIAISKFVYTPTGKLMLLEGDSNSIVADYQGTYEFRIYVRDGAGNLTFVRKTVTVTKESAVNE